MARPKEKETVMTKQGKRTYRLNKKTWKKMTWRPTKFTEEVIKKLDDLISNDVSVEAACKFVGVSEVAYYDECKRNPEFLKKMNQAQEFVKVLAWRTIAKAIRDGDVQTARWLMEKRDKRYRNEGTKINVQQGIDPDTGEVTQGLLVEFTLKE